MSFGLQWYGVDVLSSQMSSHIISRYVCTCRRRLFFTQKKGHLGAWFLFVIIYITYITYKLLHAHTPHIPRTCLIQPQLLCQGAKNFRRFHPVSGIAEKAHSYAAKGPGRQHSLEILQIAGKMVKNRKP